MASHQNLFSSDDMVATNCSFSHSETFSDSPLYMAEAWERIDEPEGDYSRHPFYHNSPRATERQPVAHDSKKTSRCSCMKCHWSSDMCISMRIKCLVWKSLCCANYTNNGCGCRLQMIYQQYFFISKSLITVLLINALFSIAIYGVTGMALKIVFGSEYLLTGMLLIHGITHVMFPVAGHLADVYIGRYNMIQSSLWLAWVGFACLGLAFSFEDYNNQISSVNRFLILPVIILILSVSYICFMLNLILFGLDQLQGASHVHYSSFFYWWYWTLNVGIALNIPEYCKHSLEMDVVIRAEIGLICITAAIILIALLGHWFVVEPTCNTRNPLLQIVRISKKALKRVKPQRIPSIAFHEVNLNKFSRMDRLKKRYGGTYETEEVEDVKTFFRMLIVLVAIGFSTLIYFGVFDTIGVMAYNMRGTLANLSFKTDLCQTDISLLDGINAATLLLFIPILDLLIVPLLRHSAFNPSILKRLGFGSFLDFLTVLSIFIFHVTGSQTTSVMTCDVFSNQESHIQTAMIDLNVYWLLIPIFIGTMAEIFIYIPGFEFICAQAPQHMRGLLIGIFFSIQGVFSLVSLLLQYLFMETQSLHNATLTSGLSRGSRYYLVLLSLSIFGLVFFVATSWKYRRRKRDDVVNEVTLIEEYFTSNTLRTT